MKGWKTVIFNVLAAIVPIMQGAGADLGVTDRWLVIYAAAWAAINLVLRAMTDSPIFKDK